MTSRNWKNFPGLPLGSYGPIGLDIGAHTVKAMQIRRSGESIRVSASATLPRSAGVDSVRQIAARLRNMLQRQNFHGRDIILAAPDKHLQSDLLELPPRSSGAPLEKLARAELGRSASMASAPFELACWDLPASVRSSVATSMMAVALRHSVADDLVDQFAAEGLTVRAIDAAACACGRACASELRDKSTTAVVDLGWSGFRLVLVGQGLVIYQRSLSDDGLAALHQEIAARLSIPTDVAQFAIESIGLSSPSDSTPSGIDPGEVVRIGMILRRCIEALVVELKASLTFAAHQFPELPVQRVIVAGGGAAIPGLVGAIQTRLGTSCEIWKSALSNQRPDPSLLLATGLSLYEGD